jgi:periplasmic divalent cation tolerance protein
MIKLALSNAPPERAEEIARALVEERLVACVNLFPVKSVYRWKGQLSIDPEVTMLMKVADDRLEDLRRRLKELHPYELPELLVLPVEIEPSLAEYVAWVRA